MAAVLNQEPVKALLSDDHFSVDGTLIEAWASMKSFRPKAAASRRRLAAMPSGTFTVRSVAMRRAPRPPIPMPDCTARGRVSRLCLSIWGTFWRTVSQSSDYARCRQGL